MKYLIAFATQLEAQATLRVLDAVKCSDNLYSYSGGKIIITGMGSLNACSAVSRHAPDVDLIWNVGIAGVLHSEHRLDSIHSVGRIGKHLSLPEGIDSYSDQFANRVHPPFEWDDTGLKLITSDYPIHNDHVRKKLKENWDLVDMEAYGICCAAEHCGKRCIIHKLISDFSQPGGPELIKKRILHSSELLANFIESMKSEA